MYETLINAGQRALNDEELAAINAHRPLFDTFIGLQFNRISPKFVTGEVEVTPNILQPAGLVNGGVLAAIAESVGSTAGVVAAGAPVVGISNSTDFLKSIKQGRIDVVARPIHLGRTTQLWRIEMSNEEKLCAVSQLRTMVMPTSTSEEATN
ncbi:PaaI family thioesterase [Corynebacterium cystitidis]|uniref:Uncharacterized domain 1-containing protein n=1 Tax=Corynebacterium cystitidis DSM 20524 TaxID=1121357 RepID=A0A1H9PS34_9CORY|nr:PaaI family thioesterase [Corynebacterium cystitidis]WJY82398.1 Putative esterase [Corynebacterium cystitidis DSM 20524]SER51126.1 uncharacterized domain 1-containing protein [Corynebacterium cystitidis DSM 20524]SNV75971.1 uncharacterized protein, possibly involved in aromatic compounds catabolism [Corynebacterium cystitidis]